MCSPWNCFLWLKGRSDKIELFGDTHKETPPGACERSPSTAIWVLSERRRKTSQSCNSGPSQRREQTRQKHPWPIGAATALRSKKNKHRCLTLSLLFKYPCDIADSIWKFRFSLPGKQNIISDTLDIDLVCMGQIAVCLRSPQCNAHHHCVQLLLASAVRGVSPTRKLQEGASLKGAGRIAHIWEHWCSLGILICCQ